MDITQGDAKNPTTWPTFAGKSANWRRSGSLGRRQRHIKQNGRSAARAFEDVLIAGVTENQHCSSLATVTSSKTSRPRLVPASVDAYWERLSFSS
jgi:hypothetical protein